MPGPAAVLLRKRRDRKSPPRQPRPTRLECLPPGGRRLARDGRHPEDCRLTSGPAETQRPLGRARILLVEDDPFVALDLEQSLAEFGYQVVARATDGEAALKSARDTRPDLALLDIRLPGGDDGVEVARH